MMGILLTILKIIGILLLSVLGLILLLLLLVLFVPIRYKLEAKGRLPDYEVWADATWLLHLLRVTFQLTKGGRRLSIKIFGIPLGGGGKKQKSGKKHKGKKKPERADKTEAAAQRPEPEETALKPTEEPSETAALVESEAVTLDTTSLQEPSPSKKPEQKTKDKPKKERKPKEKKQREKKPEDRKPKVTLSQRIDNLKAKIRGLFSKAFELKGKADKIKATITDPRVTGAIPPVKTALIRLLKHILPRKLTGRYHFGFEDPSVTGYLLAAFAVIYGTGRGAFLAQPEFSEKVQEFDVKGKGYIRLGYILYIVIKLYFEKHVHFLIRVIQHKEAL